MLCRLKYFKVHVYLLRFSLCAAQKILRMYWRKSAILFFFIERNFQRNNGGINREELKDCLYTVSVCT